MQHGGGWFSFIGADLPAKRPAVDRRLLRRVLGYARPYTGMVVLVLAAIISISLLELLPPLLLRRLIDVVLPNKDLRGLNLLALALLAIPVVSGLIDVVQRYFSARMGEGIIFDLRQQMYEHLSHMALRFFTHTKSGEIVSRFNNDVVGAQNAITGTIPNIVVNLVTVISTLAVMISIEWRLALLAVVVIPLFLLPTKRVARTLRTIRRQAMDANAEQTSIVAETLGINGTMLVKTFGRQQQETAAFRRVNAQVRDLGVRRALIGRWFFMGLGLSAAIGTALIYWLGGRLVLADSLTVGTIVAFAAYLGRLYGPISALSNIQVEFAQSMVSFERVFEYLDIGVEIQDAPDAVTLGQVAGHIRFDHVSFSYLSEAERGALAAQPENAPPGVATAPAQQPGHGVTPHDPAGAAMPAASLLTRVWALHDFSAEIKPGQLVALVGRSGAGKTTVTYLLPRLYDVNRGAITLDGHDLRAVTQQSLVEQIGIVMQETYLFHDTIRKNLLYARPHASEAEMVAAARAANIHDFISKLPAGYDTVVGERGYRLSGGEKQRLAIARVILKDPRILILDEATSHLDSENEALIQAALEPLFQGRTSVVIAHRLSTILAADKILVMDEGRLVESGSHADLLAQGGLYSQLYETQFRNEG